VKPNEYSHFLENSYGKIPAHSYSVVHESFQRKGNGGVIAHANTLNYTLSLAMDLSSFTKDV